MSAIERLEQILRGEIYGDERFSYISIRLDDAPLWLELARTVRRTIGHSGRLDSPDYYSIAPHFVGELTTALRRLQEDTP